MKIKTVFILSTLYLIQDCNGEQEISDITSDENSSEKYSVNLEESLNDDNLFNTTLRFLERLCVCLNKTLFKGDSTVSEDYKHNIPSNFVQNGDVHKNINNFTCQDIKNNVINKIRKMKAADNSNVCNNEVSEVMASDDKTEFEDVLYTSFIRTQNIRTYFINEYSIMKKASDLDTQYYSTIIILTTSDSPFQAKSLANTNITKQELYNILLKNNTMYIDIISTKSNSKTNDQSTQTKPFKAQLCNINSIYTVIMKSKNDNNLKNYKILRRKNFIKIYIEVFNIKDHENLTKLCCKDDNSIETCNNPGMVIKSNKNFVSQKNDTTKMYRSIILRIKNLIKRYFGKSYRENGCYLIDENKNKLDVSVKNKNVSLHSNELSRIKDEKCLYTDCEVLHSKRTSGEEEYKRLKSVATSINNILNNKITTALMQAPNDFGNVRQVLGNYESNLNEKKYSGELHIITEKIMKIPNMVLKENVTNYFNSAAVTEVTSTADAISSNIMKEQINFDVVLKYGSYTLVKGQEESIKKLNNIMINYMNQRISIKPSNSLATLKLISTSTTRYGSGNKSLLMTNEANEKAPSMNNVLHHVTEKNNESYFNPLNTSILHFQYMESPTTSTDLGDLSKQTISNHVIRPLPNISIGPNTYVALRQFPKIVNIKADKDRSRLTVFVELTTSSSTLFPESEDVGFEDILNNLSEKPNMSEIINNSIVMNNRSLASQELFSLTKKFGSMHQSLDKNEESATNDESLNTSPNKLYLQSVDILTTLANVRNYTKEKVSSKYLNANGMKNYRDSSTYTNNEKMNMLQFYKSALSKPEILKDVTIVDKTPNIDFVVVTNKTVMVPPRLDTTISPFIENVLSTRLNAIQPNFLLTNYPSAYTENTEFQKNIISELAHTNVTTAKEKVSKNKQKVNEESSESKINISNKRELPNTILPITIQTSLLSVKGLHARNRHEPRVTLVNEDSPVTSQAYDKMSPSIDIPENLNEEKIVLQRSKEENSSSVNVVESSITTNDDQSFTFNPNTIFSIPSEQERLRKQDRIMNDENNIFLIFTTESDFKLPQMRDKLNVQSSERSFANGYVTKYSKLAKPVTNDWLYYGNNSRTVNLTSQANKSLPKDTVYSTGYYSVKPNKIRNKKHNYFVTTENISKTFDFNLNRTTLWISNSNFDSDHIKNNNKTIFLEPNTKSWFNLQSNLTKPLLSQVNLNTIEETTTEISNLTIKIVNYPKLIHVSEKRTTHLTDSAIIPKSTTYKVISNWTSNVEANTNRNKNNKQISTLKNKTNLTIIGQEDTLRQLDKIVTSDNRLRNSSKLTKSVFDSRFRVSTVKYFTKASKIAENKLTILTPDIKTESITLKVIPKSSGQPVDKVNKKIKYNTYEPSIYHIIRRDPVTEKISLRRTTTSKFKTLPSKNKIQRDYKQMGENKRPRNSNRKNIKLTSRLPRPNRKEKNNTFKITKLNSYLVTRSQKIKKSTPTYIPWSLLREIKPKIHQLDYYYLQRNSIEKPFSDFDLTTTMKPKKFKKRTRLKSKPSYFYYLNDGDNFNYDNDIMLINEEGVYKETTQKINGPEKLELEKQYQQHSKPKYIQNRINPIKKYLYNSEYIKTTPSVNTFIRERNNMKYYNSLEDPFNYYNTENSKYTTTYETTVGERRTFIRPTRAYKRYF